VKSTSEVISNASSPSHNATEDDNAAVSNSKRSLLKAAWVPPVILAVSLPRSGYAKNMSEKKPKKEDK
jgi:hypothetical protein